MDSANLLENKAVVVTGGSRGIGRSIVLTLAAQGADITFLYCSNEAAANETVALSKPLVLSKPKKLTFAMPKAASRQSMK